MYIIAGLNWRYFRNSDKARNLTAQEESMLARAAFHHQNELENLCRIYVWTLTRFKPCWSFDYSPTRMKLISWVWQGVYTRTNVGSWSQGVKWFQDSNSSTSIKMSQVTTLIHTTGTENDISHHRWNTKNLFQTAFCVFKISQLYSDHRRNGDNYRRNGDFF